ncbi:MAG TPA: RNA-binding domain-containing protein [Candidatus Nitrosocosmicus sp.]|nr:RNA-binding domain-containing protein [Candidatus Nitrosocosmicus sp.]
MNVISENNHKYKDLEITVQAHINPSEEIEKVSSAIKNVFPESALILKDNKLYMSAEKMEVFKKVKDQIRSKSTLSVLKKILFSNQNMDTTWFLLNKQAAFSKVVALIEDEDESPLGPIKITIRNQNIEEIINWFER